MSRRGENIYKRKDGRWEARYISSVLPDGRKKYSSVYAESYSKVKEKRNSIMSSVVLKKPNANPNKTIEELMTLWIVRIQANIKTSTYIKYNSIINNHIIPLLGKQDLRTLNPDNLYDFSRFLLNKDTPLSKSTINDILLVLNMGLSFAEKEYGIKSPKAEFYTISKKEMRVLSINEQSVFVRHLLYKNDIFSFGMLLALFTGMRIGELCALEWKDISDGKIKIRKTMQRVGAKIEILPPKTQSSFREIPIPKELAFIVESKRKPEGYILTRDNGKFTEPRLLQMRFKKYSSECGINDINFHALRHTFATRCVEAGFDIKTLSDILGHSDVKTTLNKYVHSSMEQKIINMDKLKIDIAI